MERLTYNFNPGWRFYKGDCPGAEEPGFDDTAWEGADVPHGLEILPENASGGINYQGVAWYRKAFVSPRTGGRTFLRFEGVMGYCRIWLNGEPLAEHYGGYLPIHLEIGGHLKEGRNLIALMCDNSDCPDYPPGKSQNLLDFCYFGGIYRDVFLICTSDICFSDANDRRWGREGGYRFKTNVLGDPSADGTVAAEGELSLHCSNGGAETFHGVLTVSLLEPDGSALWEDSRSIELGPGEGSSFGGSPSVDAVRPWSPESPMLYTLRMRLERGGRTADEFSCLVGFRTIEFRGREGLILNGKPYGRKLLGLNRHQDYPHLGNGAGHFLHVRDAEKIRGAGINMIRSAHYPQDSAFLDACDRLGILVITATPGWQHFKENGLFLERVYDDIRQMVRRDRNRPCVFLWEPILNETRYSEEFAMNAKRIVAEEDHEERLSAADDGTPGSGGYDLIYSHHLKEGDDRPVLTREWGDSPDDWYNQNCRHRMSWHRGEAAQMTQVRRFLEPEQSYTGLDLKGLFRNPAQHTGGALWAGIDCQRGYHPDPFYGGILDLHRREKYSYHLFRSQSDPGDPVPPMVFIANEYDPCSPEDLLVFSNCEELSLELNGREVGRRRPGSHPSGLPHPPVIFADAFRWSRFDSPVSRLRVIGWIDGREAAEDLRIRPGRKTGLRIRGDFAGLIPRAGGDILPLFVEIIDENGCRIPTGEEWITLSVEGAGTLVDGGAGLYMNPVKAAFGSAPLLLRTDPDPGEIVLCASLTHRGVHRRAEARLTLRTGKSRLPLLYDRDYRRDPSLTASSSDTGFVPEDAEGLRRSLREVERQQEAFIHPSAGEE